MTGIIVRPSPRPRTKSVPASSTSLVEVVTKANGTVAAAMRRMPNGHHAARPDPVGDAPGPAHDARRADALGRHEEPGHPGLLAPGDLVVERQQEHGAEQRGADHEDADVGDGEVAVLERVQVEQRVLDVQRVAG